MKLFRELAYEVHGVKYMFGKQKPPSKENYWPIDGVAKPKVDPEMIKELQRVKAEIRKKRNGTN